MSFAIDLSEYGNELKTLYESVLSSDPETTWVIFDYDGASNELRPGEHGSGDLDEFVDSFDDARIQYGFSRVEFNGVNKIVFIGWVGENVANRQRLLFNSHVATVIKQFPTHHIQITARSSDELSPKLILDKLASAAGSKYAGTAKPAPSTKPKYVRATEGADEEDWEGAQPVEEKDLPESSSTSYKSSYRDELEALKRSKKPAKQESGSSISGLDSSTSYKPVGKIDLKAIRAEGKNSKFADARIEKIEPSYKPVGKVDIKAIREQARREKELKSAGERSVPKRSSQPEEPEEPRAEPKEPTKSTASTAAQNIETDAKTSLKETKQTYARKNADNNDTDEEEPKFLSVSERIKAFQSSVSEAKPQYDVKSNRPSFKAASKFSSGPKSDSQPQPERRDEPVKKSVENEDDEEPLSVAAQLAKARISKSSESVSEPKGSVSNEPKGSEPKASVSGFAARFAKKEEPKEPKVPEEQPEEPEEEPEEESEEQPEEEDEPEEAQPKMPERKVPQPPQPEPEPEEPETPEPTKHNRLEEPDIQPVHHSEKEHKQQHPSKFDDPVPGVPKESTLTGFAKETYTADDDDEISFTVGEEITDIEKADDNWYIGRNQKGDVGMFPALYINIAGEPAAVPASAAASESVKTAIALFDYSAGDDDELSFTEGETITGIEEVSPDWWSGENSKHEYGLFPSNHVRLT